MIPLRGEKPYHVHNVRPKGNGIVPENRASKMPNTKRSVCCHPYLRWTSIYLEITFKCEDASIDSLVTRKVSVKSLHREELIIDNNTPRL